MMSLKDLSQFICLSLNLKEIQRKLNLSENEHGNDKSYLYYITGALIL